MNEGMVYNAHYMHCKPITITLHRLYFSLHKQSFAAVSKKHVSSLSASRIGLDRFAIRHDDAVIKDLSLLVMTVELT